METHAKTVRIYLFKPITWGSSLSFRDVRCSACSCSLARPQRQDDVSEFQLLIQMVRLDAARRDGLLTLLTTLRVDRTRKGQEMKLMEMKGSWKLKLSRN
jgi:hypothetical protein